MALRPVLLAATLTAAAGLAGCVGSRPLPETAAAFPPDRTLWQSVSAASAAEHARTVQLAMDAPQENHPHPWIGPDASGSVTVERTWLVADDLLCRGFNDTITGAAGSDRVRDVACFIGGDWRYLREPFPGEPVLDPALAQGTATPLR